MPRIKSRYKIPRQFTADMGEMQGGSPTHPDENRKPARSFRWLGRREMGSMQAQHGWPSYNQAFAAYADDLMD